ncbi:AMP-binding protein [Streptomyces sp. NPDC101112]|uniref:AMP-binding protein n=1 Tax=Streptomyces sp. NPDC101112 TaxID=3366105 RepID=UPI003800CF2E
MTFLQAYGLTETAPAALGLRAPDSVRKAGSAGTPCFFTDVRVVRPDLTDVAPGEVGEVRSRAST